MDFLDLKKLYESYLSIYEDDLSEIYNFFKVSGNHVTEKQFEKLADKFIDFCVKELKIKNKPKVHFVEDPKFAERIGAFGAITADDEITIDTKKYYVEKVRIFDFKELKQIPMQCKK